MAWAKFLVCLLLSAPLGLCHPGEEEKIYQHAARPLHHRSPHISQCKAAFQEPEFIKRTIERRHTEVERLRKERGIKRRASPPLVQERQLDKLTAILNKDHQVKKPFNKDTKAADLFADDGACMTAPLVSEGPLYVSGEQVRRNLTEGEAGVPITLDIQVVDAKTCLPLKNAAVDIWGCNTTGIYSGVWTYYRRPDGDATYDRSVINATALRGIQFTDDEGVAKFDTFFPGHYEGRAVHIHVIVHLGAKLQANGTITGGQIAHISQLYFDQKLITEVEKLNPYTKNVQNLTLNSNDGLLKQTTFSDDPFFRYVKLGDKVEDGIFSYIRLGVDTSAEYTVGPAAYRDESGGHQNLTGPGGDGSGPPRIPPNPTPYQRPA
ncbi:Intradiol ring-cleavage dioxygenase-like protein [Cercophora newfieldiana]|uniref:Intradiol ring-cleavage dioxygenase-like protein n=1 Tax=Cercophora newfieldiana TaxID=92897 RepID=A0AA39YJA2_9PEZI|nr:Intradiol ring-cleavage dioxygenase-like protein [Cercophora newfieldiana]